MQPLKISKFTGQTRLCITNLQRASFNLVMLSHLNSENILIIEFLKIDFNQSALYSESSQFPEATAAAGKRWTKVKSNRTAHGAPAALDF